MELDVMGFPHIYLKILNMELQKAERTDRHLGIFMLKHDHVSSIVSFELLIPG